MLHCVLSRDGRRVVSASDDGTLRVWDLEEPEREPRVLRGHEDSVRHCVLSRDGRRVVSASDDGTLRVWDLEEPEGESRVLRGHEAAVFHCVLSRGWPAGGERLRRRDPAGVGPGGAGWRAPGPPRTRGLRCATAY